MGAESVRGNEPGWGSPRLSLWPLEAAFAQVRAKGLAQPEGTPVTAACRVRGLTRHRPPTHTSLVRTRGATGGGGAGNPRPDGPLGVPARRQRQLRPWGWAEEGGRDSRGLCAS